METNEQKRTTYKPSSIFAIMLIFGLIGGISGIIAVAMDESAKEFAWLNIILIIIGVAFFVVFCLALCTLQSFAFQTEEEHKKEIEGLLSRITALEMKLIEKNIIEPNAVEPEEENLTETPEISQNNFSNEHLTESEIEEAERYQETINKK